MVALTLAFRNVMRRRERSLLTLVGVLLAVGSFVAMVSLAEGMYKRVSLELDGRDVGIYVTPLTAAPLPTGPVGTVGLTTDTIGLGWVDKIKSLDNVKRVCPITRLQFSGKRGVIMVLGISGDELSHFLPNLKVVEGKLRLDSGHALLGTGLAASEGLGVGNKLKYGQIGYPITGLVSAGAGFQDYFAYLPLETALGRDGKGAAEVWVQLVDPHRFLETEAKIEALRIPGSKVLTRKEYLGSANEYIQYAWFLQFAISAIGVLIAITAAMNTMLMSTYERMREFGTLRAIGASRATVVTMVVTESVILSLVGGMLGIAFGWMGSVLLDRAMVVLLQLSFPLASVTTPLIVEAVLLSIFVGLVGAAIPSALVWRVDIVRGLRWN